MNCMRSKHLTNCSSVLQSTLLTGVATAFFIHIQEQFKFSNPEDPSSAPNVSPAAAHALLVFAYVSILANCTASIVSFYLANRLLYIPMTIADIVFQSPNKDRHDIKDDGLVGYINMRVQWTTWRKSRNYCTFLPPSYLP